MTGPPPHPTRRIPILHLISNDHRPLITADLTPKGAKADTCGTEGGSDGSDRRLFRPVRLRRQRAPGFETVEATRQGRQMCFSRPVRIRTREVTPPWSVIPNTVMGANGHDYLLHFTQFLFFLKALELALTPTRIARYIEAHYAEWRASVSDPQFTKSRNEFRKADLSEPERKAKILDTIRTLGRAGLRDLRIRPPSHREMSPKTTEKLIEDLRFGGVLARRIDDRMSSDQKRVLIASTGFLEDTYRMSLLMQRRMICDGPYRGRVPPCQIGTRLGLGERFERRACR